MERKPSVKKRAKKTVTKRVTRKKTSTDKDAAADKGESTPASESAASTTSKKTTTKPGARSKVVKKAAGRTAKRAVTSGTKSPGGELEVQTADDAVVIRFPPAGAPPFPAAQEVEAQAEVSTVKDKPPASAPPPAPNSPEPSRSSDESNEPDEIDASRESATTTTEQEGRRGRRGRRGRGGRGRGRGGRQESREADARIEKALPTAADRAEPDDSPSSDSSPSQDAGAAPDGDKDSPARRRRGRRRRGRSSRAASPESAESSEASSQPDDADDGRRDATRSPDEPVVERDSADEAAASSEEGEESSSRRRRGRRGRRRGRGKRPAVEGESPPQSSRDAESAPSRAPTDDGQATPEPEAAELPAVKKEMIINAIPREECRIAILEEGKLQEIYLERASSENHVGNIYKGRITNVEPSIQAAFIDFGLPKNGFLHISDLHPEYFPNGGLESERVGRKTPRRDRPPIQRCLRRGQEILVQIIKEGIGTKGPTLTTYLSIAGRFLVMLPGMKQAGVSRKIEDSEARDKLRAQMADLELPDDMGFIARTAAMDHTKRELQTDLNYLMRLWKAVDKRIKSEKAPAELYRESDLVIRTIRDVFSSDIDRILVDDEEVAERAKEFLSILSPRARDAVVIYKSKVPIFHHLGIEAELERLHSRHVPLKSGGSLVFDSTEALVAVDVNSGSFREHDDAEETAYKINLEAAEEIARQLRLRDLGGVIVCDFIDMRFDKHKRAIERTLTRELKAHKERAKVLRMSGFGLIEMTRQRQRASLMRNVYQDCQHCRGTGLAKTAESVALDVMRLIQLAVTRDHIVAIEVTLSTQVARLLQNRKRGVLYRMETEHKRGITILSDSIYGLDQVKMQYFDQRGRAVPIS